VKKEVTEFRKDYQDVLYSFDQEQPE
jgi:hypothetical protein